jgi:uncharacterized 2Fe-2S/4Fe-4S cluster protein (DUF4445 family)
MPGRIKLRLLPLGAEIEVERGGALESVLAPYGVEFPCGGAGICRGCRVRVLEGAIAVTPEMRDVFTADELAAGWRLACCARAEEALTLELAQWELPILADDTPVPFEPAEGVGIAIDLGTTTVVAQAVDLTTGEVLGVQSTLNPQVVHGADVMSRIEFALDGGGAVLAGEIRDAVAALIGGLPRRDTVRAVLLAGNTAMHHLFCGIDVAPLASVPFQPANDGEQVFSPRELGWNLPAAAEVRFLPCLGGFVGSDVLAGIIAAGIHETAGLHALIDLGTNGEIVLGNCGRMLCASTAAGPAFEAGRIRMGMRAASGAIAHVAVCDGGFECRTIGNTEPRGICGSGLVDAVAAGIESGAILTSGRLANGRRELVLAEPVAITQADIRELQLAKGAIAAGLRILTSRWGASTGDVEHLYLAGAFGNYVNIRSARRIGLLEIDPARIVPAGNTSLRGLKMALLCPSKRDRRIGRVRAVTEHVPLASDPGFQDTFAECLGFPA